MVVITTVIWGYKPTYNILWPHIADHPFRFWKSSSFAPRNHKRSCRRWGQRKSSREWWMLSPRRGHSLKICVFRIFIGVWKIKLSDISLKSEIYPK